jgi:tetratricopeptide (TPR) repeat protein
MNRAERRRQVKLQGGREPSRGTSDVQSALQNAISFHKAGRHAEAESLYEQILEANPHHAEALHLSGILAYQTGRLDKAVQFLSQAIQQDSGKAAYFYNLGVVLQKQGKLGEAASAYLQALVLNPRYVEALSNLGTVLMEQDRWEEAAARYKALLGLKPDYVEAHNNLGAALKELGRTEEAMASYRKALALKPDHVEAHCNLGTALLDDNKLDEAVASFERALALKPDYVKAHYNLAFAFLRMRRLDEALVCLRKSANLKYNHGRPVPDQPVYKSRLKHDVEQVQYLLDRGVLPQGYAPYLEALKRLRQRAAQQPGSGTRVAIGRDDLRDIVPSCNRILHYADCPALSGGVVNPGLNVAEIEARYNASYPEVTYIDGLLTDEALQSLRKFCLESTIWKRDYENGYVGAFFGDGFACPLLLQIAVELRERFHRIFKDHPLLQTWAFKCDSEMKALNLHADAAAVNVNFWITPDEANLDPESGGLIVWDKEAPKEWNFKDYNSSKNEPKVRAFLRTSGAKAVRVPYRQNRAIVFNSDLFHESDVIRFREGYEHRRINVTLLYGRRQ